MSDNKPPEMPSPAIVSDAETGTVLAAILSFCYDCGTLLPPLHTLEEGRCPNCAFNVQDRDNRIEGMFYKQGADKLLSIYDYDPLPEVLDDSAR